MWFRRRIELETLRSNVGFLNFNRDPRIGERVVDGEADEELLSCNMDDETPVDLEIRIAIGMGTGNEIETVIVIVIVYCT